MIQYEKHPLNSDEIAKIRGVLLGQEIGHLKRCLQCNRDSHYLNAMNLRQEAGGQWQKRKLEADGEEQEGHKLASFIQTLDTLTSGDYQFFTIKVNS